MDILDSLKIADFATKTNIVSIITNIVGIGVTTIAIVITVFGVVKAIVLKDKSARGLLCKKFEINPKDLTTTSSAATDKELYSILKKGIVASMKIICYGDRGYGGLVNKMSTLKHHVKLDIVVLSPDRAYERNPSHYIAIKELINQNQDKVVFHQSDDLPSIRACVLYDNSGKSMWVCIQHYKYSFLSFLPPIYNSHVTFIARSNKCASNIKGKKITSDETLLKKVTSTVEQEFKRLSKPKSKKMWGL